MCVCVRGRVWLWLWVGVLPCVRSLDNVRVVEWLAFVALAAATPKPDRHRAERCLIAVFGCADAATPRPAHVLRLANASSADAAAIAAAVLAAYSARDTDNELGAHVEVLVGLASATDQRICVPAALALGHVTLKHINKDAVVRAGGVYLFASLLAPSPSAGSKSNPAGEWHSVQLASPSTPHASLLRACPDPAPSAAAVPTAPASASAQAVHDTAMDVRLRRIAAKALANLAATGDDTASDVRAAVRATRPQWYVDAARDQVLGLYLSMLFDGYETDVEMAGLDEALQPPAR